MKLIVSNYGATILGLMVPTASGDLINVVVGLEKLEDYLSDDYQEHSLHLGSTIGRYAGRISSGGFNIDDNRYNLFNVKGVHLHGGSSGFDKKCWDIVEIGEGLNPFIKMTYKSRHMEEGYPGNLEIEVSFTLLETNALKIEYTAKTDRSTPINLTNHAYFNLSGEGTIINHSLAVNSHQYLELNDNLIPTGKILAVENTHFDYRKSRLMGDHKFKALDDCYVVDGSETCVKLSSPKTKIQMTVSTNQPAVVIYTHDEFPAWRFSDDKKYGNYPAICFETQNFPDAPNQKDFPNSFLQAGHEYRNETVFKFDSF